MLWQRLAALACVPNTLSIGWVRPDDKDIGQVITAERGITTAEGLMAGRIRPLRWPTARCR
ncbi:unannotated protein [freshwater metagenome]|uniref:Unannotated protein n=1 Tax=freshwater metagenome TaxID=449393 RepID=A0A6J7IKV3_9ZZZZ